jgi:SAM-dependent methyltransferase
MHKTGQKAQAETLKLGGRPVCNLCGGDIFDEFAGRSKARCVQCGSLERTRVLGLHLERIKLRKDARVLHVAPESSLVNWIRHRYPEVRYDPADIDPDRYEDVSDVREIDLCRLEDESTEVYDLIVHAHVLEHTPCNLAYTIWHLHRMLKPEGRHIFVIPIVNGRWDESFDPTMLRDMRVARFRQWDHVRLFGRDDLDASLGTLISLDGVQTLLEAFGATVLAKHVIPERSWHTLCPETVIDIGKYDTIFFSNT